MSPVTQTVINQLRNEFSLQASKSLGQNFLIDPNISKKIASCVKPGSSVIEVGPGVGSLTVFLAHVARRVYAIEYDKHLLEPLDFVLHENNVHDSVSVIHEDIMKVDLSSLCEHEGIDTIVGNLPYNISAPLIADISRYVPQAQEVVVMVQKEVAERIAARQGTRGVAGVTLKCQYFMDVEILFHVPPQSFFPKPRVDSTVMKLTRKSKGRDATDIEPLFSLIDTAFAQRRKMLRQSIKSLCRGEPTRVLEAADVDPTFRPEQCTIEDFMRLNLAIRSDRGE